MDTILKDFSITNKMQLLSFLQKENNANRIYDFMQDNAIWVDLSKKVFIFQWKKEQRNNDILAIENEWNNSNVEKYILDNLDEFTRPNPNIIDRIKMWISNKTQALNGHYMETLPAGDNKRKESNPNNERNNSWDMSNYTGYDMNKDTAEKYIDEVNTHKKDSKEYR